MQPERVEPGHSRAAQSASGCQSCHWAACSRQPTAQPRLLVVRDDLTTVGSNRFDDSISPVKNSESTVFKDGLDNTLASEGGECTLRS